MADNYTLGRGIVYLSMYDAQGNLGKEIDVGNAPELSFNIDISTLEHFSSRSGIKAKDKEIVTEVKPSISFVLDEMKVSNMEMFLLGSSAATVTQVAATATTVNIDADFKAYVSVGKKKISSVVVKDDSDVTTYVEGTDYIVDSQSGGILALSTGAITSGDTLHVTFDNADLVHTDISALTKTSFEAQLKYVSDNPVGPGFVFTAWKIMIKPDGSLALIGTEDLSTMSFSAEILKDEANHASSPYLNLTVITS